MIPYHFMNKDTKVLEFVIDRQFKFTNITITNVLHSHLIPADIANGKNLAAWLDTRLVLSHRTDILKHFSKIGITNLEDIIDITKCISLNDTYWVKRADSRLSWKSVSPYTNSLNSEIAHYSFDGTRQINSKLISHSPDFATSGNYPKCWKRVNERIYLYKAGTSLFSNAGQEPYSEYLASVLADQLNLNHIKYELVRYRNKTATRCECMCTEQTGLYGLASYRPDIDSFKSLLNDREFQRDKKFIIDTLLLDYLTLNTDRHFNNIGVLVDNDTQFLIGISPIYDNNMSLLPYYKPEQLSAAEMDHYISRNDGEIVSADGTTFDDLYRLIKSNYVIDQIKQLRGFRFDETIPRADVANLVLQRQIDRAFRM